MKAVLWAAFVVAPVLVIVLAVEGDWGLAVACGVVLALSWWRGRHNGRYLSAGLSRQVDDRPTETADVGCCRICTVVSTSGTDSDVLRR